MRAQQVPRDNKAQTSPAFLAARGERLKQPGPDPFGEARPVIGDLDYQRPPLLGLSDPHLHAGPRRHRPRSAASS